MKPNASPKKRRTVMIVTAAALVALLLVGLTLAYLTDQRRTLNVLGLGSEGTTPTVKIKLTEPQFAAHPDVETTVMNPGEADEYEKIELYNIVPGQLVNKDPTITNIGADDVYLRVKLENTTAAPGEDFETMLTTLFGASVDTTKWMKHADGYWYYTNGGSTVATLATGASVPVLLGKTVAAGDATAEYPTDTAYTLKVPATTNNNNFDDLSGVVNMQITAEAIQARAFTPDLTATNPWAMDDGTAVPIIAAIR